MKKRIYLAGSCSSDQRTLMVNVAKHLREHSDKYDVYCPFELQIPNAWDMSQEDWSKKVFEADLNALNQCDIFLMISPGRHSTAGTNWEQGYAFAKGKRIIVLQITNDNTSLMTYCGCDVFINSNLDYLDYDLDIALRRENTTACRTVLT